MPEDRVTSEQVPVVPAVPSAPTAVSAVAPATLSPPGAPSPYPFRTFLVHKPLGVVSSTVDNAPAGVRRGPHVELDFKPEYRKTVWNVAEESGFSTTNVGLVGRLDCETSGIIMFSNDSRLSAAIRDPPKEGSPLSQSPYKSKEYELTLLSSKPYEEDAFFDIAAFEKELAQPLTFSKENIVYNCVEADVKVLRRYRDVSRSRGRGDLGWTIVIRVVLREGKHHQIRRLAHRAGYHIVSLHRRTIASILSSETIPTPGQCRYVTTAELDELYAGLLLS